MLKPKLLDKIHNHHKGLSNHRAPMFLRAGIYMYYIYPELRIGYCRFGSETGAAKEHRGVLREYRGVSREHRGVLREYKAQQAGA